MEEREHRVIEQILELLRDPRDGKELEPARRLMEFMEEMPGGFLIYRAGGGEEILYANRGLLRIFQCENTEEFMALTGGSFRGMVHPEDLEEVEESICRQIAASRFDLDYVEYRIIRRDGALRWIEDYGHFIRSEAMGDVFYVFLADATEKTESRRREREHLLREKEQSDRERDRMNREHDRQLEVIEGLGASYDSIFYADLEKDKILPYRLSSRTEDLFISPSRTLDYAKCLQQYILRWVHPDDRERVVRETETDYARRRLAEESAYCINYRVLDGGETQYLQLRFINVGQGDRPRQLVLGCRRMDEELRRELEQKQILEEALHQANASISAKNTFLSNMSHDMRTPLNAIFGFTALARNSLARGGAESRGAMEGYLNRIEDASRQLLDLIDKVLTLSWMDTKEARAEESPCCLGEILEEVRDFLLPQAREKSIDFTLDCSGVRHDAVYADREKLSQLVMYLANNAVTYTPAGGSVSITAAEAKELPHAASVYRIAVRDTGVGIGPDFLQQIFEPFTRERNTTLSGIHGVGLGLTIAKNLADLLGGAIEVSSAVDHGSTFTVTLRLRTQHAEAAEEDTEPPACHRILVVEDNELNREIEVEVLTTLGFEVDTAEDGSIAVERLRSGERWDMILMDIQMPVMDGWTATRTIRALPDPDLAGIPIVALSANVFESDIQTSLDAGMDAHLAKPVDVPELLRTIKEITAR